jgi:hypothetical protein
MAAGTDAPTLTDRYVETVVRALPARQRDDVARELRASVADQVEGRVEAGEPADVAERAVLTELGDPDELAAGYADRPLWLVGPRFFVAWRRLVVLLLWIVTPIVAFAVALGQTLSDAGLGTTIGTTVGATITTGVHLVFWTTVVFAVLERHATPAEAGIEPWTLDRLAAPERARAPFWEMVTTLVFLALAAGVIVWDRLVGLAWVEGAGWTGEWMPVLDPALWPWWVAALFAAMAATAALSVLVWARGGWTYPLATGNALLNVVVAGPTIWLLAQDRLFNPELVTALTAMGAEDLDDVVPTVFAFLVAGIAVWSVIDAYRKAHRRAQESR